MVSDYSNTEENYRKSSPPPRFLRVPLAIEVAHKLDDRLKRSTIPVRAAFVVSAAEGIAPPMTQLLRGGRGGEVKLKLLLSMIWVAAREPFDVTHPARVWAELLGLEDPEKKGAARINAAIRRLVESGYLSAEKRPGMPSKLTLRDETGRGSEYVHPGRYWDAETDSANLPRRKDKQFYLRLPKEFWTNGWVAALSGPAIAMLLALFEQTRGSKYDGIWFSQSVASRRYGLTEVTRRKGLSELEEVGIIEVNRERIGLGTFDTIRYRNTYAIERLRLSTTPMDLPIVTKSSRAPRLPPTPDEVNLDAKYAHLPDRESSAFGS